MTGRIPTSASAHSEERPPRELLERIAERLRALGDPTRLAILHALGSDELCVSEVAAAVGTSQANVSKHLGVLRNAGLVRARREGMNVFYSVSDASAFDVCRLMCGAAQRRAHRDLALLEQAEPAGVEPHEVTS